MKFALTGAKIFDGQWINQDAALIIENDSILDLCPRQDVPADIPVTELNGGLLTPGFIDLQINGAGGVLLNNAPNSESLKTMAKAVLPFGVTRIMPTIITDNPSVTVAAIDAVIESIGNTDGILGIHVEGPFFSEIKKGVHQLDKIRTLEPSDWNWLKKLSTIPSILTLAPDHVAANDIAKISQLGIRVCAGHTNATYQEVVDAHNAGLSGFTHLYNAMRPMTGREPGVVGAALTLKDTWAGMIADGIHVHDMSMEHAFGSKGYDHIFLVSDAMATIGSNQKEFKLYGETIEERNGRLVNAAGHLAGSAISLLDAVQYCVTRLNVPIEKALAMASRVPAEYMQLADRYGSFKPGAIADICYLNDDLSINTVWQSGSQI